MNNYEMKSIETNETPPPNILIPVGEYDGVDLLDCAVLDDSYTVYLTVKNPELI